MDQENRAYLSRKLHGERGNQGASQPPETTQRCEHHQTNQAESKQPDEAECSEHSAARAESKKPGGIWTLQP
jgi:hypothetical protein